MDNIICRTCKEDFDSWGELANHINISRDNLHKQDKAGKKWAANFKYQPILYKNNKDREYYNAPLTAEQKITKVDSRRILSGKSKLVPVRCPRCNIDNHERYERLEIEHIENPQALMVDNCYIKFCEGCR